VESESGCQLPLKWKVSRKNKIQDCSDDNNTQIKIYRDKLHDLSISIIIHN